MPADVIEYFPLAQNLLEKGSYPDNDDIDHCPKYVALVFCEGNQELPELILGWHLFQPAAARRTFLLLDEVDY